MKLMRNAALTLAAVFLGVLACAAQEGKRNDGASRRPNILFIISDDIGMDVTTGMYPRA